MVRNAFSAGLLLLTLILCGCGPNRFDIRLAPNSETCIESLLHTTNELAMPNGKLPPGLELENIRALAIRPENLSKAVGNKQYILHFFRRNPDIDEEVSPIKFPFYWEIDSTKVQTEGTYLVQIKQATDIHIAFHCSDCQTISPDGKVEKGKKPEIEKDFDSGISARHCNEDACFAIRPRKLDLSKEVGKTYLVKVEAQQTYLAAAKPRIEIEKSPNPGNFTLRFRDQLAYRALTFVKELGIAMALADKADREKEIYPQIDFLKGRIDALRDSIRISNENPAAANPNDRAAAEKQITELETERVQLQMEAVSLLPRLLVISPGMPCVGK